MSFLTRRKPIDSGEIAAHQRLIPTLGWPHLVALGVGAIVGTGIYTLIGTGAGMAGPAVMISFAIAGAVCAAAALCYAEMATMMPQAGSAYTYSYAVMGETTAWVIGWSLILEYTLVCAAVSVGWAGYASGLLTSVWPDAPRALLAGPHEPGGFVNLPAVIIALAVGGLLMLGTRESARVQFRAGDRQAAGPGRLRGPGPAGLQPRPLQPLHDPRLERTGAGGRQAGHPAGGGDHLLRLLRLRRHLHGGRGGEAARARPDHRHRRVHGPVHGHLYGRRPGGDRGHAGGGVRGQR